MRYHRQQKGFTLVELLVVIGIIAILFAVVLVAINPAKRFAETRNARRQSDTRNVLTALTTYAVDNRGNLPPNIPASPACIGTDTAPGGYWLTYGTAGNGANQFQFPRSIAFDSLVNKLIITDRDNNRIVRVDSGSGGTTLGANWVMFDAGGGQFNHPRGITLDSVNNKIYFADSDNGRIVQVDSGGGGTTFGANLAAYGSFGAGATQFSSPTSLVVDTANNKLIIMDYGNNRIVRVDSGGGGTTFGLNRENVGAGVYISPEGVALDPVNNKLYIADAGNNRVVRIDSGGGGTTFGANGLPFGIGPGSATGQFNSPWGVFVDAVKNRLYVADTNNRRIVSIDSGGGGTTLGANWLTFGAFGAGSNQFDIPNGLFLDFPNNKLYVADSNNNRIAQFNAQHCYNLAPFLAPEYLATIPKDPQSGTDVDTGYEIWKALGGAVTIRSATPEKIDNVAPTIQVSQ
ncbi:hypothetical protein A2841_02015 [Candidatus Kaiserbacteria bacterium RIFCSPHIGHO2_01_FULL_48_10]|uniref:Prepilin-type N-terminal cleavage/methylation domain-containing protein n=1 Tax=Candidatus Kaiserbacteria bacterium RIFCSPHIGHO2_01_FULL_48_10 TaxID=1798476 RepID=A0A1F6C6E7_9BACT|nr:MAG: hypothetical protein A2841_02015 [Candidatus Kaiserbacteria bacterium RIFCSPHIGHO2_01_FULL_48_10]HLD00033.1 prepilin-type N-terminal cleavage/methylation domain-containing protein [Patescibacteria group bacterium]